jgi:hypothetical protein
MVEGYEEQANGLKLILPSGDIDFAASPLPRIRSRLPAKE